MATYDERHGGAYDRGGADSYYGRAFKPHYFAEDTYNSQIIYPEEGSPEWKAYEAGYKDNEKAQNFKDWG
jgi:hypothetical protein